MRSSPHGLHSLLGRRNRAHLTAASTLSQLRRAGSKRVDGVLDLAAEIGARKRVLVHHLAAPLAVPSQLVQRAFWPRLLDHQTHCVCEPHWVVRRICWQKEYVAFVDVDVSEGLGGVIIVCVVVFDYFEEHTPFVLVEELWRRVDVVVGPRIGPADDHDC